MKRIANILIAITALVGLASPLIAAPAYAAATSASKDSACGALNQLDASQGCGSDASKTVVSGLVSTIVNLLSVILGVVAVIMIIIGGFRFITSGGDSSKVASARNTIVFALIGLIVAALAQFIVHFVLSKV